VDVRMLVAGKSDHPLLVNVGRSYYEELLRYGVKIYEYEAGINHAKVALIDKEWFCRVTRQRLISTLQRSCANVRR
jgi:cardiolipin synthase